MSAGPPQGVPAPRERGWLTRARVVPLALAVLTAVVVYQCYVVVRPFVPALAWALALAVIGGPLHRRLARRLGGRPNLAAGLTVLLVAMVIVVPAVLVTHRLAREAVGAVERFQEEVETGRLRAALEGSSWTAPLVRWVETSTDTRAAAEQAINALGPRLAAVLTNSVWIVVELFVTLFALFFLFRDSDAALATARRYMPLTGPETDRVFARIRDTIHATVFGTVTVAFVQGLLGGLMFWWLGLPAPLVWGAIMALLAIVPVLGAFVVWLPASVYLAIQGGWGKALLLAAWGGIVISLIDNLLYPALVGKELRLHTLPVFFAVVGGIMAFGAAGLVIGPVLLAVAIALAEIWRQRFGGERETAVAGPESKDLPDTAPAQLPPGGDRPGPQARPDWPRRAGGPGRE
jgi:predicted PurR-regulated permease PerM